MTARVVATGDWRLTNQMAYMKAATLAWRTYVPPSESWDHDHCEFCFAKFLPAPAGPDVEVAGYVTLDDSERWVCKRCFDNFRDLFAWNVEV